MDKIYRYVIALAGTLLAFFITWYFSDIVVYILVSAVLALMARPLVEFLSRISFKGWIFPRSLAAGLGLMAIWLVFYLLFRTFIPLLSGQAEQLSSVNIQELFVLLTEPFSQIEAIINRSIPGESNFVFREYLVKQFYDLFDIQTLKKSFDSISSLLVSFMVAAFAISFITFFFMKDEGLFSDGLVVLFPTKYEAGVRRALASSNKLLVRYFIGVVLDMTCVMLTLTIGLICFTNLSFGTAIIIGLIAGILNVIPYVGPVIAAGIGVVIAMAAHISLIGTSQLSGLVFAMGGVFIGTKVLDDILFQPYIFSNSVRAHPLEIFLLILIAGNVAGIIGMLIAIPAYTVLRVFAKEFFNNFRVVQKLTGKI